MAPTSRRRRGNATITTTTTTTTRIVTRSIYKKQQLLLSQQQKTPTKKVQLSPRIVDDDDDNLPTIINDKKSNVEDAGCTTPKSEKYKIPEIVTCPPAPKKPRVSSSKNCLVQTRRPITFFAHPDLDKFFMFATRDIKV